jgi:hypothetical protein
MTLNDMLDSILNEQIRDIDTLDDAWNERYKNLLDVSIRSSRHYHKSVNGSVLQCGIKPDAVYESVTDWLCGCTPVFPSNGVQYMGKIKVNINE